MNEKRLDIYVDAVLYIALKARANECERSVSQHVRKLIRDDIEESFHEEQEAGRGSVGGAEGE